MSGAIDTLFLPFATGDIDLPASGDRFMLLNASVPQTAPDDALKAALVCEQGNRAEFLALQRAGYQAQSELDENGAAFAGALILVGKHRDENHAMIARAGRLVSPGGVIVVAGDKMLGIASLRKWASARADIDGSLAKHHATVFWFSSTQEDAFADVVETPRLVDGRFETASGMFSAAHADPGSSLLAEYIDDRVSGAVADFGCGWGYLAARILEQGKPQSLALFEAHYPSLKAAERNLAGIAGDVPLDACWQDLTAGSLARQFDWIVMNPPFHSGRASESDIGKAFIVAASKALKPGGRLLMVANRKLPYEHALAQGFRRVEEKAVRDGFKIIEAVR